MQAQNRSLASTAIRLSEKVDAGTARVSYLARLLDVLEAVGDERETPPSVSEIAQATDIPLSTVSRLLALLGERRLVRRLPRGRYGLGVGIYRMALRGLSALVDLEALEATVRTLARATGESASAGLLVDDRIVLVARRESEHRLRMTAQVGDVVDPHLSAMGKAVLAYLGQTRRLEIVGTAVGARAASVLDELSSELERVRSEGFARDEETYAPGLRCRAAPILGLDGSAIGAVSVAGPAGRFTPAVANDAMPLLIAETTTLSVSGADA